MQGWSKDPKKRLPIQDFQSALHKMLLKEEKKQSLTLKGESSLSEKEGHFLSPEECEATGKTEAEFCITTKAGDPVKGLFNFDNFFKGDFVKILEIFALSFFCDVIQ
jgi:hypothetical protein